MRLLSITTAAVLALDQASKWLVVEVMNLRSLGSIEVLPPYLTFRMAWNRGVNFGLFSGEGMRWVLIGVALAISAWVLTWAWRERGRWLVQLAAGFLVGGALGNVADRLFRPEHAVADFLNMSCCGFANPYAFNIADVAIFLGAAGLILASGRSKTP